jgi:hypothetical protein
MPNSGVIKPGKQILKTGKMPQMPEHFKNTKEFSPDTTTLA